MIYLQITYTKKGWLEPPFFASFGYRTSFDSRYPLYFFVTAIPETCYFTGLRFCIFIHFVKSDYKFSPSDSSHDAKQTGRHTDCKAPAHERVKKTITVFIPDCEYRQRNHSVFSEAFPCRSSSAGNPQGSSQLRKVRCPYRRARSGT